MLSMVFVIIIELKSEKVMDPLKYSETVINLLTSIKRSGSEQSYFLNRLHSIIKTFKKCSDEIEANKKLSNRRKFFIENLKESIIKSIMICPEYQFSEKFPNLNNYLNKKIPLTKEIADEFAAFLNPKDLFQRKILIHLIYAYPVTFRDKKGSNQDRLLFIDAGLYDQNADERFRLMKENLASHIPSAPKQGILEYELMERRGLIKENLPRQIVKPINQESLEIELMGINGSNELYMIHGVLNHICMQYLQRIEEKGDYKISSFGRDSLCCSIVGNGKYSSYRNVSFVLSVDPTSIFRNYSADAYSPQGGEGLEVQAYTNLLQSNNIGFYLKDLYERIYLAIDSDVKGKLNIYPYMKSAELFILQSQLASIQAEFDSEFKIVFDYDKHKLFSINNFDVEIMDLTREQLRVAMNEFEYDDIETEKALKKFDCLVEEVIEIKIKSREIQTTYTDFHFDQSSFIGSMINEIEYLSSFLGKEKNKDLIEEIDQLLSSEMKDQWKEKYEYERIPNYLASPFFVNKLSNSYNEINIISDCELNMKIGARPIRLIGIFLSPTGKTMLENGERGIVNITLLAQKLNLPILANL